MNIQISRNNMFKSTVITIAITALTAYLLIENKKQQKIILEHTRYLDELRSIIHRSTLTDNFNTYLNSLFSDGLLSTHKFFSNMQNQLSNLSHNLYHTNFSGNMNIVNNEKEYIVTAALPGFTKEEITINLSGSHIEISAKQSPVDSSDNETNKDQTSKEQEREVKYNINISGNIDRNNIKAQLKNGLLTIKFPKIDDQNAIERKTISIDESY
jgi:HSP20 family protein